MKTSFRIMDGVLLLPVSLSRKLTEIYDHCRHIIAQFSIAQSCVERVLD